MLILYILVVMTVVFAGRRLRQIDQGQNTPVVHASPLVMVS
jgi:hypothetical protein